MIKHGATRRSLLKGAAAAMAVGAFKRVSETEARSATRPNIVFVLADDLRYDAVGYVNKRVRTPNLDRLGQDGVRFLNAFVTTSICCTSRASIFTGAYARRHGVWDFETSLPATMRMSSYPALLRNAGYRTGFFGKYGVGDVYQDEQGKWFADRVPDEDRTGFDVIEAFSDYYEVGDVGREHHNSERIAEKAKRFIQSTSASQPFCLSLSFKAPHANDRDDPIMGQYVAEPDLLAHYARDIFTEGPTVNEAAFQTLPQFIRESESRRRWQGRFSTPWLWQDSVRKYYALVSGIDRAIGRVMAALERKGIAGNTVVVFTSDNGYFLGDYGLSDKWYGYEASIRVPLMIRPVRKPQRQEVADVVLNLDLAPTMLALAGLPAPQTMSGRDLSPLYSDITPARIWRTDFLYEHYQSGLHHPSAAREKLIPSSEGVRTERYTYLRYPRHGAANEQLFDRVNDPHELRNVVNAVSRDLVEQLRKRTDELIAENA